MRIPCKILITSVLGLSVSQAAENSFVCEPVARERLEAVLSSADSLQPGAFSILIYATKGPASEYYGFASYREEPQPGQNPSECLDQSNCREYAIDLVPEKGCRVSRAYDAKARAEIPVP